MPPGEARKKDVKDDRPLHRRGSSLRHSIEVLTPIEPSEMGEENTILGGTSAAEIAQATMLPVNQPMW